MATSEDVQRTALALAERGEEADAAIRELLACCGDHRVSVVVARQTLSDRDDAGTDATIAQAIELLTWCSLGAAGHSARLAASRFREHEVPATEVPHVTMKLIHVEGDPLASVRGA